MVVVPDDVKLYMIVGYLLERVTHAPETKSLNQGVMRTQKARPNLSYLLYIPEMGASLPHTPSFFSTMCQLTQQFCYRKYL